MRGLNYNSALNDSLVVRVSTLLKILMVFMGSILSIVLSSPVALSFLMVMALIPLVLMQRYGALVIVSLSLLLLYGICLISLKILGIFIPMMAAVEPLSMLVPFLRMGVMAGVILTLVFSSSVKRFTATLKTMRLPIVLYLPLIVSFRFIPTFINDCRQISESMRIRGIRLTPLSWLRRPNLTVRMLVIPAVIKALSVAEDLALAADWKGVGQSRKITPRGSETFSKCDGKYLLIAIFSFTITIVLQINFPGVDMYAQRQKAKISLTKDASITEKTPPTSSAETPHPAQKNGE